MRLAGLLVAPVAVAGWVFAGAAQGAGAAPSMEVLPKPTGLKYGQTVEIKGHHLPKGSGSVAATICGLNDASGKAIAKPTADDCAGAPEVGKLVVVKSWQSNGEFDTKYTLPTSGQKFGKNARFCNKTHHCALVVADANPNAARIPRRDEDPVRRSGAREDRRPSPSPRRRSRQPSRTRRRPGPRRAAQPTRCDNQRARRELDRIGLGFRIDQRERRCDDSDPVFGRRAVAAGAPAPPAPGANTPPATGGEAGARPVAQGLVSGLHATRERGETGGW